MTKSQYGPIYGNSIIIRQVKLLIACCIKTILKKELQPTVTHAINIVVLPGYKQTITTGGYICFELGNTRPLSRAGVVCILHGTLD